MGQHDPVCLEELGDDKPDANDGMVFEGLQKHFGLSGQNDGLKAEGLA